MHALLRKKRDNRGWMLTQPCRRLRRWRWFRRRRICRYACQVDTPLRQGPIQVKGRLLGRGPDQTRIWQLKILTVERLNKACASPSTTACTIKPCRSAALAVAEPIAQQGLPPTG